MSRISYSHELSDHRLQHETDKTQDGCERIKKMLTQIQEEKTPLFVEAAPTCGTLLLEDGTAFEGVSFGYTGESAGEVVFSTGMVGYPEAFTDPSFSGQILAMTYPLIGNYGVPMPQYWESQRVHLSGLVVSSYVDTPSHAQNTMTLSTWLRMQQVPALEIKDTRRLTQHIREHGAMLGKIVFAQDIPFYNPNEENLVARVSTKRVTHAGQGKRHVVVIDCGAKQNIVRCLLKRGVQVTTVPWDWDPFTATGALDFDALVISNGPGNPKLATATINTVEKALALNMPTLGICLGNQLLALAAGGDTYKLKFGHRSQNQPCLMQNTKRCYITTQNHGFAVGKLPPDFTPWFINANDGSNEGIMHVTQPFMSVQFHPEAHPGPQDTEWVFDYFLERVEQAAGSGRSIGNIERAA
jgi:carbamoyl-phosphate synthase small subunit